MRPDLLIVLIALIGAASFATVGAESSLLTLQANPFSRPEALRAKPPPPPAPVVVPPEEVELELTATMVSETAPMVIVNGELLAPGDRIEGMRLIAVFEGRAIFTRDGKRFEFEIERQELNKRATY